MKQDIKKKALSLVILLFGFCSYEVDSDLELPPIHFWSSSQEYDGAMGSGVNAPGSGKGKANNICALENKQKRPALPLGKSYRHLAMLTGTNPHGGGAEHPRDFGIPAKERRQVRRRDDITLISRTYARYFDSSVSHVEGGLGARHLCRN